MNLLFKEQVGHTTSFTFQLRVQILPLPEPVRNHTQRKTDLPDALTEESTGMEESTHFHVLPRLARLSWIYCKNKLSFHSSEHILYPNIHGFNPKHCHELGILQ